MQVPGIDEKPAPLSLGLGFSVSWIWKMGTKRGGGFHSHGGTPKETMEHIMDSPIFGKLIWFGGSSLFLGTPHTTLPLHIVEKPNLKMDDDWR